MRKESKWNTPWIDLFKYSNDPIFPPNFFINVLIEIYSAIFPKCRAPGGHIYILIVIREYDSQKFIIVNTLNDLKY